MIVSEKYHKSIVNDKIYDTVLFADIMDIEQEKYFIVSGHLFNERKSKKILKFNEDDINNTFFNKSENADMDAYYLIYNLDKKKIIENRNKFIQDKNLNKMIRLDRTQCEKIKIGNEIAYKINTKQGEYIFIEMNEINMPYVLVNKDKGKIYEKLITFDESNNKANLLDEDNNIIKIINKESFYNTLLNTRKLYTNVLNNGNKIRGVRDWD